MICYLFYYAPATDPDNMDIKFEGEVAHFIEPAQELCKRILTDKGYTKCTVHVEPVGKRGDNYVANVRRFTVQQDDVNDGKPFKMVGKLAPTMEQLRQMMNTDIAFQNEIITYEQLLPKYDELQQSAQIPTEERIRYPKCYGTISEGPNETIFLEDMNELGFFMHSRFVTMSDEQIKLALKDLAKLHALGYVLKEKEPAYFDNIKSKYVNMWVVTGQSEQMKHFLDMIAAESAKILYNENDKKKISTIMQSFSNNLIALNKSDVNSRYATIIQGDCWTNNMVFKYENEQVKEIVMLDYQIVRPAPPVADVFYLLLNCTDHETIVKHFYNWLDYYYKSFDDYLSNFNMKASYVYPRDKLDADLQRYAKTSIALSILLANMLVREAEDVADFKEDAAVEFTAETLSMDGMKDTTVKRYTEKVNGLIKTSKELGYI